MDHAFATLITFTHSHTRPYTGANFSSGAIEHLKVLTMILSSYIIYIYRNKCIVLHDKIMTFSEHFVGGLV